MAAAFQQQIFALDARFNAYRAPNNPNFSKISYTMQIDLGNMSLKKSFQTFLIPTDCA